MPRLGRNRCYYSIERKGHASLTRRSHHELACDWLLGAVRPCGLSVWLGIIGLARDERVAPGMQWLALISALLAFIGMCYFGAAANLFGWS